MQSYRVALRFTLSFIALLFCWQASAASPLVDIHFSQFGDKDGLGDKTVMDIAEDQHGFIWFATNYGLMRTDGYKTTSYFSFESSNTSLSASLTRKLLPLPNGDLWVGSSEGIARYDASEQQFLLLNKDNSALKANDIWALYQTPQGDILIADAYQLYQLFDNDEIRLYNSKIDFPDSIKTMIDDNNLLLIGSYQDGLFVYDKTSQRLSSLLEPNIWNEGVASNKIFDIKKIDKKYWVASENGIYVLDTDLSIQQHISEQSEPQLPSSRIFSLLQDGDTLWIGTELGLAFYDLNEKRIISNKSQSIQRNGLNNQFITKLSKDSTGAIWVGSLSGVFRYHPSADNIKLYSTKRPQQKRADGNTVWGVVEDSQKRLWFVTQDEGIGLFDKASGNILYYPLPIQTSLWDIAIDNDDRLWLASSSGIIVISFDNDTFSLKHQLFPDTIVYSLLFDGQYVWFQSSTLGLTSVDTLGNLSDLSAVTTISMDNDTLADASGVFPIYRDAQKHLWLNTQTGLIIYNPSTTAVIKTITKLDGLATRVLSVREWGGNYWVVTQYGQILKVSPTDYRVTQHSMYSLKSEVVSVVGLENALWLGTSNGLSRVDLPDMSITEQIAPHQLQYNTLTEGAAYLTRDNTLIFGGTLGLNKLTQEQIRSIERQRYLQVKPSILELRIYGNLIEAKDYPGLSSPIYETTVLSLDHKTRFSLTYGIINPIFPHGYEYRYILSGWDKAWTEAQTERTAYYNDVSFGDYQFRLQSRRNGGEWSDEKILQIHVERPAYLHNAALIFYAVLLLMISSISLRNLQIKRANQKALQDSEERLKLTLWSSGDELWDWDISRGRVFRSNTWGILDFPLDHIRIQGDFESNVHPADYERLQRAIKDHLTGKSEYFELTYRVKTFKNEWVWLLDRGKIVVRDDEQHPVRMTGTLKNISHLKQAEEQLNLFKRSIENISEGVFITDTAFRFISVNNAYCRYTGESREQALASYMYFHQYPEAFTEEIKKTLRTKGNWLGEVESVRINGERYEMELSIDAICNDDGKPSHFVGVFSDITSRKSTEKELLKLANSDPLTDLPNRSFFQASHQNLVRRGEAHALICMDMDNFKKVNDSLGHQTGDVLIKQVAKRLQRITGKDATCYRLGGDEFALLLEEYQDVHTITHYVQAIIENLSKPFIVNKQELVLGASIGIALYPSDGTTPQELLKNADTAMYFAKNSGGNSYQFFSGEMNQHAVRQLQIEGLIRQGLREQLFNVYYQPKVDITTGKLVSMEALVRFEHPFKGIVSPGQFIPLAEQTGQIIEIGEQVLRKACIDTKRWVSLGLFSGRVAVNISAKQFELADLDDRIERILREVGLSPLHLECEITEGTLMANPEQGLQMMQRLRDKGIHLALDDFGTGYSSLAYLKRFPLNTLKIDKAFVDDIAISNVDRQMAAAIINIAHNLGLKVVAEGVETEEQLAILRRYECEMLQGFLYSKALTAERFESLLSENQQLTDVISKSFS